MVRLVFPDRRRVSSEAADGQHPHPLKSGFLEISCGFKPQDQTDMVDSLRIVQKYANRQGPLIT